MLINGRLTLLTAKLLRRIVEVTSGWLYHTSVINETEKRTSPIKTRKHQTKGDNKQTDNIISISVLYPSVLMNPFTVPSAKSETISPIWRKLVCCRAILQHELRICARQKITDLRNSTEMRRQYRRSCRDFHGCFFALLYKGIQRKNKQTEYKQVCEDVALKTHQLHSESALRAVYRKDWVLVAMTYPVDPT